MKMKQELEALLDQHEFSVELSTENNYDYLTISKNGKLVIKRDITSIGMSIAHTIHWVLEEEIKQLLHGLWTMNDNNDTASAHAKLAMQTFELYVDLGHLNNATP